MAFRLFFFVFTFNDEHASKPVNRENHSSLTKSEKLLLQTDLAFLFCVTQRYFEEEKKIKQ